MADAHSSTKPTALAIFSRGAQLLAEATTIQIMDGELDRDGNIAGIYMIEFAGVCIYIGHSANIAKRIAAHEHGAWFCLRQSRLYWFECRDRHWMERQLIERCRPLLNGKGIGTRYPALMEAKGTPCDWAKRFFEGVLP